MDLNFITSSNFQEFCNSNEESNSSFIPVLLEIKKNLNSFSIFEKNTISIAASYGKRLILTAKETNEDLFERKDFIEIIDVDPVKNSILFFGPKNPPEIAPLLWMMHYAKKEIQFSIFLPFSEGILKENIKELFPIVGVESGFLDVVKDVMRSLQNSDAVILDKTALILTADNKKDLDKQIEKLKEMV